jgi:hypothetical protein
VPDTADGRFADIANDSCVDGQFHRPWGGHLVIDNDSWRGRFRGSGARSGRSALLFVVGTEGPDHGLLKVIHEVNCSKLDITLCLGNITTVSW